MHYSTLLGGGGTYLTIIYVSFYPKTVCAVLKALRLFGTTLGVNRITAHVESILLSKRSLYPGPEW